MQHTRSVLTCDSLQWTTPGALEVMLGVQLPTISPIAAHTVHAPALPPPPKRARADDPAREAISRIVKHMDAVAAGVRKKGVTFNGKRTRGRTVGVVRDQCIIKHVMAAGAPGIKVAVAARDLGLSQRAIYQCMKPLVAFGFFEHKQLRLRFTGGPFKPATGEGT